MSHAQLHDGIVLGVDLGRVTRGGADGALAMVEDGALDAEAADHVAAAREPRRVEEEGRAQRAQRLHDFALPPLKSLRELAAQHREAVVELHVLLVFLGARLRRHRCCCRRRRGRLFAAAAAAPDLALGVAALAALGSR